MSSLNHKINQHLMIGWMVMTAVFDICYLAEVLKGERTISYLLAFMIVTAVPAIICLFLYRRKPDNGRLGYYIVVGYFLMYLFCMVTGSTGMVFSYILPMLFLLVLYHQPNLILYTGIAAVLVNVISVILRAGRGEITVSNSKDAEIQIGILVLCFIGSYLSAKLYDEITRQNFSYVSLLDEKNKQIEKITLQTITTIINTIDDKDEYTKGHSRRVSEYSAAIAREMGYSEEEISNIRSIALLHDIGKIGVPDSVLSKPGRLTDAEFWMMKQHTLAGAELLKDISTIPGLEIGAKYHHERYDGTGYPEGLKGEEIPMAARIVAVADTYDAMTSNRVYRNHLSPEKALSELKEGLGKQFDPVAGKVMIRLLEENRLEKLQDGENTQETEEMSRILSRIMEKQEEKLSSGAGFDDLTGVWNKTYGEKLIKKEIENGSGCLLFFDLDHFRHVNSNEGFAIGDIFLMVTANCLKEIKEDTIVSRFGGDEFIVLFKNITEEKKVREIMDAFMENFHAKIMENDELENRTVSAGIVFYGDVNDTFTDLMKKADRALYVAKQQGGGAYCFHNNSDKGEEKYHLKEVDLHQLVGFVKGSRTLKEHGLAAYPKLYEKLLFIRNIITKYHFQVQLLMFTVLANEGIIVPLEDRGHIMEYLEQAIVSSVHHKDIMVKYSSNQRIVMLINPEADEIGGVIERIMKEFFKVYDRKQVGIYYDIADLRREGY